ncbi:MAG: flagellar hook-associated protein FlgL [Pseudomonadota bacterium]
MRVSTAGTFLTGLTGIQRLQTALDQTQRQIASGRRLLTPSDDPIAAGRALELRESLSRLDQFERNGGIARNRLALGESALKSANDVLQRVRELAVQANNATQSNESRELIAIEMREQLDNLVQIANQKDGSGAYLFSGNLSETTPVTRLGANFTYNGDQGQRLIQIGEGRQIADGDPGSSIFFKIRTGNGSFTVNPSAGNTGTGVVGTNSVTDPTQYNLDSYQVRFIDPANYEVLDGGGTVVQTGAFQPGQTIAIGGIELSIDGQPAANDEFQVSPSGYQNVFESIDALANAVARPVYDDATRAALNNDVNANMLNIDQGLGAILDVRTQVGSRLAAIESQTDTNASLGLTIQETLSALQDLDYAEALSRLSLNVTTLEAAQQSFVRTQQLSLFDYF